MQDDVRAAAPGRWRDISERRMSELGQESGRAFSEAKQPDPTWFGIPFWEPDFDHDPQECLSLAFLRRGLWRLRRPKSGSLLRLP